MKLLGASVLLFGLSAAVLGQAPAASSWRFAVSGDSRNCGDVVMPSIAAKARADKAEFYWHLGDYRALYDFDQDMLAAHHGKLGVMDYTNGAWQDFIDQQLAPFDNTPVFLAIGNHELVGKSRPDLLVQFADWFDAAPIRAQRLHDDPADHALHGYYHWRVRNVDFITLDNASPEQFDHGQIVWFEKVLKQAEADPAIRTVVVGMHDALPDSLSAGHSMNESPAGTESGRRVYGDLVTFRKRSGKEVEVLASHSHFVLSEPYRTACRAAEDVLPGWIVGTAGAVRYRLPAQHAGSEVARTDVYGYLLATVSPEGHVSFHFNEVTEADVAAPVRARYGAPLVRQCFAENRNPYTPEGPVCSANLALPSPRAPK